MFRKKGEFRLGDIMLRRIMLAALVFFPFAPVYAAGNESLNGRYNIVLFDSDHATEFTSGIGYLDFDGAGSYRGKVSQVSQGQSTGSAFDAGPVNGTYSVSSSGKLTLGNYDSGYICSDGSLIVWAPVPGDIPYEETGINVGIKEASGMGVESLDGSYNIVLFDSDHATEFTSGLGYVSFDGAGSYTGEITEVAQGQSTGSAFDAGPISGIYSIDSNGVLVMGNSTGFVSADGSLIVWAPVPGDVNYEETGINVGIKETSGMELASLSGTYNIILFDSDHATEFTSGIGYVSFDGAGSYTGQISEVSQGQSTGSAFDAGPVSGTYSVDPNGKLMISNYSNGYISTDCSLIVWAPVPGDTPYEETGINIGIKQPLLRDLSGEYWFGSLSAGANSWLPWGKAGSVIINGNNWYQEWDDYDGHHSYSGTFTTSVRPDGSINVNHAWGSYNVAWNGNIMVQADTAPDAEDHLGFDIIARKETNIDVNDVIGNYSFFGHWLDGYEPEASVGWGNLQINADGNGVATWVEQDGNERSVTAGWALDDVNGVMHVSGQPDAFLCEDGIIKSFRSIPDVDGDFGYNFFVKESNEPITPEDIAGTYIVRFLETSVFGQPFTCGKGTAIFSQAGNFNIDVYYSNSEHAVIEAEYTINSGNRLQFLNAGNVEEGIIASDMGLIFVSDYRTPNDGNSNDWIGGIFLVRTSCNIADLNADRWVNFFDYAAFAEQWLKAEPELSANFNRDSQVDWLDLKIFAENWLWNADWYTP